ncbi:hypothetical protein HMPREF0290_1899 [Corynebacterium efficiens YS-314]|nr:hypothetical protein HMPREF0290_1899 [Corynebacterium efficiens YS-314]
MSGFPSGWVAGVVGSGLSTLVPGVCDAVTTLVVVVIDGVSDGVVGEGAATVLVGAVVVIVVGPVEPPSPLQPATPASRAVVNSARVMVFAFIT